MKDESLIIDRRYKHFKKRILKNKSGHLNKIVNDVFISRNFLNPDSITKEEVIDEVSLAQAKIVSTLKKEKNVYIMGNKSSNIICGIVFFKGETTVRIKDDNKFYQLSEIIAIE